MKIKKPLTLLIYLLLGIFIIIITAVKGEFKAIELAPYFVGGAMIIYSISELINQILEKELLTKESRIPLISLQILTGILMIIVGSNNLEFACIIWATWTFMREAQEIEEKVVREFKKNKPFLPILNLIESLVVIFFSVMLMFELEEGIYLHMFILGIEFILEWVWVVLERLTEKKITE